MCSRFEVDAKAGDIKKKFEVEGDIALPNAREVRPTDLGLVIDFDRKASLLAWGFPSSWDGKPLFNARAETITEKPSFSAFLEQRCIVPATMFPEWRKDGKNKFRNSIFLEDTVMGFAGLRSDTHFTIITCAASPAMAHVHGRMPAILTPDQQNLWLDANKDFSIARGILQPYEGDNLCIIEDAPKPPDQADLFQ